MIPIKQLEIVLQKQDPKFYIKGMDDVRFAKAGFSCGLYYDNGKPPEEHAYFGALPYGMIPERKNDICRRGWRDLLESLANDKLIKLDEALKDIAAIPV